MSPMRHKSLRHIPVLLLSIMLLVGMYSCHQAQWNAIDTSRKSETNAPEAIAAIFNQHPNRTISFVAESPGYDYNYDIGEKDASYSSDDGSFRFTKVEIHLLDKMPQGKVLTNLRFSDKHNNAIILRDIDLLRLIPAINSKGEMQYAELLLEEYNRFGFSFRKEFKEYEVALEDESEQAKAAADRIYRVKVTNNCLAAGKWELEVTSEDYTDFADRREGPYNINQNRIFSHSWFFIGNELHDALLYEKNPGLTIDPQLPYDSMSNKAERVVVNFDELRRPIRRTINTSMVEIGHQSNRKVEPLDIEQYFKEHFGLLLSNTGDLTYKTILDKPIETTRFVNQGFYYDTIIATFDLNWMQYMDSVHIEEIDQKGSMSYMQITLTGKWCPYNVTIGNIDLSLIEEQKLQGHLFGVNTYPKGRRYNPRQATIQYDADMLPEDIQPFVLLTDSKTGKWVNNQYKGIEKIYFTYDSMEHDVLNIYVLSYERITPVWMCKVKLPTTTREAVRIRRQLYNY